MPSELEKHYINNSQLGVEELKAIFLEILQQLGSVFFVLDALDECNLDQRTDLVRFFTGIIKPSLEMDHGIIKLFVASRKEDGIERAWDTWESFPKTELEVEAAKVDSDIKLYVQAQIKQRLPRCNTTSRETIITTLTTKADGMYVFPFHHLYSLINII